MMPKWKEIDGKIRNNSRFVNNRVLFLAHKTVKYKLEFAFFHKATLFKAYHLQSTHAKTLLKRCMTENVIINLSSSLDAIAHEINQINGFSIPFYKVQIDHHRHGEGEGKHCLRCKLDGKNSNLADFVKTELPRRIPNQQNSEHWYFDFQEYRNQIIHRTIYVLMLEPGMDFLPDDPTILDPTINGVSDVSNYVNPIYPNYTRRRELSEYSEWCLNKVIQICERIYEYLNPLV